MTAPTLTGFAPSITFDENTVNGTPQLLDADVVFADVDEDFDGGALTLTGLLAEDRVSVRNQGSGAGQIGLSGTNVTYGGVTIGTLAGGVGGTLTITFNASATSEAIDALIQNLTYANVSNSPTASRTLILNVTDAAGGDLGGPTSFAAATGVNNPFNGITSGGASSPAFVDLDGDGDQDLVLGRSDGTLSVFRNGTNGASGSFAELTGADNPFDGIDVGNASAPTFTDLDGDGDLDLVVGESLNNVNAFRNGTAGTAGAFTELSGAANPFNGLNVSSYGQGYGRPTFVDLDGDGDLDLVTGEFFGRLQSFRNGTNGASGSFTTIGFSAAPLNVVGVSRYSAPAFVDLDGDGDMDLVVGRQDGTLNVFRNGTDGAAGALTALTGSDNPFNGIDFGDRSTPTFADVDNDGDLDLVVGRADGTILTYLNTTTQPARVTVTVTTQNDAPTASGLPSDVTVTEDVASNLDLSAVTLADLDNSGSITVTLTASAGTMTAADAGGVTVSGSGTGTLVLTGTVSAIDTWLNTASAVQYTGALNASGNNAATVTASADDGSGSTTLGVVNVDITAVNDPVSLTGFAASITFAENTVNATPQLLDADVTFTDPDNDFNGGTLTLSGLLAEDRASVRDQGTGTGQIGLAGTDVTFGGVVIGVLSGGSGNTLTVTFNAAATSEAVDALIQNLTYANVSHTPTASRDLVLNVTDAAGSNLGGALAFTARTGASNPFSGMDVGTRSAPTLADLDGDGDLDVLSGENDATLPYYENTGTASAPVFTLRTGAANPFDGVDVGFISAPTLVDMDGDGDLDALVGENLGALFYFENTGTTSAPVFTQRTGAANPFNGVDVGSDSRPTLADLDGDGDLDALIGEGDGVLNYFENTGTTSTPVFTQRTGAANPFNGIDIGSNSAPSLGDVDGDGDLDALVGDFGGLLYYFENTGTASAPVFTQRTGTANPFNGVDVGQLSTPALVDFDGDGDADAVIGAFDGVLNYFANTTSRGQTLTVTVTAQNDAPTASGLPTDVTVTEDVASNLNLSAVTLADLDNAGSITVTLTASAGTMTAADAGGVTVSGSGTGTLVLTGTISAIDTYLNTASAVQYTGALNANGDNAATVTVSANDGSGSTTLGVVNVDITAVNDAMSLTGFGPSVTFDENTVNATPQLLDIDVSFSDPDSFNGGSLTLSGLLAEDRASVRNEGAGAGQIGLSGIDVTYGGVTIGTLAGGVGGTLTITFNASATATAIDALIQNLTYANVSNTPTAARNLVLNVTDASGDTLGTPPAFVARTGAANPFNGIDVGVVSTPALVDLDGDGDRDAVFGELNGTLLYFENTGTASAPVFTARTGAANPFDGVDVGARSALSFADLDGDGDLDALVGEEDGFLNYFENTGTTAAPVFTQRTGAANPFNAFDVGAMSTPALVDLDGDGDHDAVVGEDNGALLYFENTGTTAAAAFTQRTGAANPFNGVDVGFQSAVAFTDLDGDGDLDAMVGENDGTLRYFENTGTSLAPAFTQRSGAANPFNGVDVGNFSNLAFADVDGDGDMDAVVGEQPGTLRYFENTTINAPSITVTVTTQNDAPTASGLPTDVTVTEDVASNLNLSAVTLGDLDNAGSITVTLAASAGTMTAADAGGVTVSGSGTGTLVLTGTVSAIDTWLNTASRIQYTGASNANGDNAATVTVSANDGSGSTTLGVVNVDITAVNDAMSLTGFGPSVTFDENTVNATPQLLDIDVTFTDPDSFTGGALTITGVSADDRYSVRNEGTGAGQIGLSGTDVTYGGVVIGTLAGGVGASLTITFNGAAASAAIDALIQNLTYANLSDTPNSNTSFTLNITDAAGDGLLGELSFGQMINAINPLRNVDVGSRSSPTFVDLDNDGDFDAVVGTLDGDLAYYENTGTTTAPVFTQRLSQDNPFDFVLVGSDSAPTFADLDNDGDQDLVLGRLSTSLTYFENTGTASAPAFTQRTGAANPFNGFNLGSDNTPSLGDLDGDGDLDVLVGRYAGGIRYLENTGTASAPVFVERTGAANPLNGVSTGSYSAPSLVDADGDGDLDVVVASDSEGFRYFENTGGAATPAFTERTGTANPFNGISVGVGAPAFADLDGDGDVDAAVGDFSGQIRYLRNNTQNGQIFNIFINSQNDAPTASGLPTDVTVTEDVASNLNLSAATIADGDSGNGPITVTLTAGAGTMTANDGGGVTVSGSGGGTLILTGTAANIDAFLNTASNIQYTGAANAGGNNADTVTVSANDGSGSVTLGVVNVDITAVNDPMSLTGFEPSATFGENTVNGAPQLLDTDVSFSGVDSDFNGGTLTLSGLLAEDRVSVRNEGTDAGQIGLSGSNVTYGGVTIGTLAGGDGGTLTITFNAAADDVAIDALIQNLTYANVSDTPTASRNLVINITDAAGVVLTPSGTPSFIQQDGSNPFSGTTFGNRAAATFGDLDGDGDLDAIVGIPDEGLRYYVNTGTAQSPVFEQRTGMDIPFGNTSGDQAPAPVLVDVDADGDLDLVLGNNIGMIRYFENTGTAGAAAYTERTGAANPFAAIDESFRNSPTFGDVDGDGDLDLVVGEADGGFLNYFENTGTAGDPVFVQRTGAANPFDGLNVGGNSNPFLVDIDGDGDLDAVVGQSNGSLTFLENTGTAGAPTFVARTGAANPFDGIHVGYESMPTFVDLDGDGHLDAIVGNYRGYAYGYGLVSASLRLFENRAFVTVNVTAQNDVPAASGLPSDVTVTEDVVSNLNLSAVTLTDADSGTLTVVLTASAGTMTATGDGDVTVDNSGTGTITLTGTASAIDNFLNNTSAVQYTGVSNANGNNAATVTITADDGTGTVELGVVNVDITAVNDRSSLTGFVPSITFAENTVNATPQLLDSDVVFADVEGDFNGGSLTLSGLLAEDRASVRNEGVGAGQIGLSGTDVSFGGVVIGTLAGGAGATLTITFNAAATPEAIDALIQNLTYANVSDTPTASRTLTLNVTDAAGLSLAGASTFTQRTDAANPFDGIDVVERATPTFVDLDGDGDLDVMVGDLYGRLNYFENTGSTTAPVFTQRTGAANPFNGVDIGNTGDQDRERSAPTFTDLDGDGDLDALIGELDGTLNYFENTGTATVPVFVQRTGAANPLNGVDVGQYSNPTFADLDGDGDRDLVVGDFEGRLNYFENTGSASVPAFTQRTGSANPFNGIDVSRFSIPAFADLDGDGDLDATVGSLYGPIFRFENTGTSAAPVFVERTGAANPFNGVHIGSQSAPTFADLDGDGDLDALIGARYGQLFYFEDTTARASTFTVNVTAQADTTGGSGADTLTGTGAAETFEGFGGDDILSGGGGNDTLDGGEGVDTADYSSAASGVRAQLNGAIAANDGDGGSDTLVNIENLTGSAFNDLLIGSDGVNVLTGGLGADTLLGLGGNDTLIGGSGAVNTLQGGLGDDTYVISQNDTVTEFADQGTDTIRTDMASYVLRSHFENLTYTGSSAFTASGNSVGNVMTGAAMNDILQGLAGDDTLVGRGGYDILDGAEGSDTASYVTAAAAVSVRLAVNLTLDDGDGSFDRLAGIENVTGSAFNDLIFGDANGNILNGGLGSDTLMGFDGNDTLIGGAGATNTLQGGLGDDTYVVSVADTITELSGEGTDTVQTDRTVFNLGANLENLTYTGSGSFVGNGNGLDNVIRGGTSADTLSGGAGNDTLIGGGGAANTLIGGEGDDTYVVTVSDTVVELNGGGTDTVQTDRAFYTLANHVENLTYTGSGVFNGRGNALDNVITGGAANDVLSGGQGNDTLNGGAGTADVVVLAGNLADYTFTDLGGGSYQIIDTVGGRDGTDLTTGVERVRFATGGTVLLSSLAVSPTMPQPVDKTAGGPEVLPGLTDDDFLPLAKGSDLPLVLPGAEDPFADLFVGLDRLSLTRGSDSPWEMLTLDADGTPDNPVAARDHSGWNHDGWLF